jgi:hypothetical protein
VVFTDVGGGDMIVDIRLAEHVVWTPEAHLREFPTEFADVVKILLLSWSRIRSAASTPVAGGARGFSPFADHWASSQQLGGGSLDYGCVVARSPRTRARRASKGKRGFEKGGALYPTICLYYFIFVSSFNSISMDNNAPPVFCAAQDVLLKVVGMAAPKVPLVRKPKLPPGTDKQDYSAQEIALLFDEED